MEGRGEIAIPKKLTTKNRGKRKRNTKKPYTGDLLSISNSDHGMSTEYLNASSSDHLISKNASKLFILTPAKSLLDNRPESGVLSRFWFIKTYIERNGEQRSCSGFNKIKLVIINI